MTVKTLEKTKKLIKSRFQRNQVMRLFNISAQLTETLESILEDKMEYNKKFLKSLKQSIGEMKKNKVIPINSLSELK
jgi:hypothetical protein